MKLTNNEIFIVNEIIQINGNWNVKNELYEMLICKSGITKKGIQTILSNLHSKRAIVSFEMGEKIMFFIDKSLKP